MFKKHFELLVIPGKDSYYFEVPSTWVADYILFKKLFELLVTLNKDTAIILRHHLLGWRDRLDCV